MSITEVGLLCMVVCILFSTITVGNVYTTITVLEEVPSEVVVTLEPNPEPTPQPEPSTVYYNATSGNRFWQPIVGTPFEQMQLDINECPYSTAEFQLDVFDCSNMCAMLHDWLEMKGYVCQVYIGCGTNEVHAWLLCNNTWVESTSKSIELQGTYTTRYTNIKAYKNVQSIVTRMPEEWEYPRRW